MKRRDFIKKTGAITGGVALSGVPMINVFGQSSNPTKGGVLRWGHSETSQNIDMHQTGTASTHRTMNNIMESLFWPDENLVYQPVLATGMETSADGLTHTIGLRKDVKFHNGQPMTSADVKYSLDRILNPDTGATSYNDFKNITEVVAVDDHTVRIHRSAVDPFFKSRIGGMGGGVVMPEGSGDVQGTDPIGTGAFQFVSRTMGSEFKMKRFDGYWGQPAYLDGVDISEVTEATTRLTGLMTGEFDVINDVPLDRVGEVQANSNVQTHNFSPVSNCFLNFNHGKEPFGDPRVRLAMDYCIDKPTLVQGALWGQGGPETNMLYGGPAYNNSLKQRPQDFDKARSLLKEAGVSGLEFEFAVTTNYPWHVDATQIMAEWFKEAGIKCNIKKYNWSDWLANCWIVGDVPNYDVTMMNFFGITSPSFFNLVYHSMGGFNYRSINDPALDELIDRAGVTIDGDKRNAILIEVQKYVHDQAIDVVLWRRDGTNAASKKVGGLDNLPQADNMSFFFKNVWIES